MFEFIQGELSDLSPATTVIITGGIGYIVNISVNTYSELNKRTDKTSKIFIHQIIREDAHTLYGFINRNERAVFRHLISVSGIGANTARMMLSSLTPTEVQKAILSEDITLLKSIKGIGLKTVQRMIVDLKDKIGKISENSEIIISKDNTIKEESLSALIALGFPKNNVEKVINKLFAANSGLSVEELIKLALKSL